MIKHYLSQYRKFVPGMYLLISLFDSVMALFVILQSVVFLHEYGIISEQESETMPMLKNMTRGRILRPRPPSGKRIGALDSGPLDSGALDLR